MFFRFFLLFIVYFRPIYDAHSVVAPKSKYDTRLNDAQHEALESAMYDLDVVLEKEHIVRVEYEKKILILQSELCAQMSVFKIVKIRNVE